jgi:hypothetical protein
VPWEYLVRMDRVSFVVLVVALLAVFFYVLFVVVRAAVRGALQEHFRAQGAHRELR